MGAAYASWNSPGDIADRIRVTSFGWSHRKQTLRYDQRAEQLSYNHDSEYTFRNDGQS